MRAATDSSLPAIHIKTIAGPREQQQTMASRKLSFPEAVIIFTARMTFSSTLFASDKFLILRTVER